MTRKIKTPGQIADVIERFVSGTSLYPQEFNDFFESARLDPKLDVYRERCEMLHIEFEPHKEEGRQQKEQREAAAMRELEQIVAELRLLQREAQTPSGG